MNRTRTLMGMVLSAMLVLTAFLAFPAAAANPYEPGDPGYAYDLKVGVNAKKRVAWGSAENADSLTQVALQYRSAAGEKWKVVRKTMGNDELEKVVLKKNKASKGFYRTRVGVQGIDCSKEPAEPCSTKNYFYFSEVKRLR